MQLSMVEFLFLQYVLKLLGETLSVKGLILVAKTDSNPVLPYLAMIQGHVLSVALSLPQKDEYELAASILSNILFSLTHTRPVLTWPAQCQDVRWSKQQYQWAKEGDLEKLKVDW